MIYQFLSKSNWKLTETISKHESTIELILLWFINKKEESDKF